MLSFLFGFPQVRRSEAGRTSRPLMANTGLRQGLRPAGGGWRGRAIERAARAAKNAKIEENRKGDVPIRK